MTLNGFIESAKVKMTAELVDQNPNMFDMPPGSTHWRCVLRAGRSRMTVYFSQGPAVSREPDVATVLDCLANDASGYDNTGSFEDWADEYGYDIDSRKAERTYRAVEKQALALRRLLGESAYQTLLYGTDRV
jgi:hypothetical protein